MIYSICFIITQYLNCWSNKSFVHSLIELSKSITAIYTPFLITEQGARLLDRLLGFRGGGLGHLGQSSFFSLSKYVKMCHFFNSGGLVIGTVLFLQARQNMSFTKIHELKKSCTAT